MHMRRTCDDSGNDNTHITATTKICFNGRVIVIIPPVRFILFTKGKYILKFGCWQRLFAHFCE